MASLIKSDIRLNFHIHLLKSKAMFSRTEPWISKGYEAFALGGESMLKVELLAKEVGISKSSFYHHFIDLDFFINELLNHHVKMAQLVAEKEQAVSNINPGLIEVLLEHKVDVLFNRQLRIHAAHAKYKETLALSNQLMGNGFVDLWLEDMKLKISRQQADALVILAFDQFFLQLHPDRFNRQWLEQYFDQLKQIGLRFDTTLYGTD
jgi:AcrR family transcriptional regulator